MPDTLVTVCELSAPKCERRVTLVFPPVAAYYSASRLWERLYPFTVPLG